MIIAPRDKRVPPLQNRLQPLTCERREIEAKRHQRVVSRVVNDEGIAARVFHRSIDSGIGGQKRHGQLKQFLAVDGTQFDIAHVLHGPASVVIGTRIFHGIILNPRRTCRLTFGKAGRRE